MTRYWFDTEFMEDGQTIELLSIGVVCEDGREFYAENMDADLRYANEWVQENVFPHLAMTKSVGQRSATSSSRAQIASELLQFVNAGASAPEFWAYYADYDWVVLCQLYGRMVDLPASWPKYCLDLKQWLHHTGLSRKDLPAQETEHHALADARWNKAAWEFVQDNTIWELKWT